jgi:hypothetical protein
VFRFSEEAKQKLEVTETLITFFGLSEKDQKAVMPVLHEENKYDFSDGDLVTSNVLEILMNGYIACLNSILIDLMIIPDESDNKSVQDLVDLIEQLLQITHKILDKHFDISDASSFGGSDWDNLRQLSLILQQSLKIWLEINTKTMRRCVEYWLHA